MDEKLKTRLDIARLFAKKLADGLDEEETRRLEQWLTESPRHAAEWERLRQEVAPGGRSVELQREGARLVERRWREFRQRVMGGRRHLWMRTMRYAAIVLVPLAAAAYLWTMFHPAEPATEAETPIVPGTFRAQLTLDDGRTVALDSAAFRSIGQLPEATVEVADRVLTYTRSDHAAPAEVKYNMLDIPRGGEYALQLADSSRVWLNAETRLRYPVTFAGTERRVELTGEAYFEVSKDATRPFIVRANGVDVRVLGTVFNVNAYPESSHVRTTLVEGKVETRCGGERIVMKPGTQVAYDKATRQADYFPVDVRHFISWKDGYYDFRDMTLGELMQIFVRWYDVDVRFANPLLENLRFSGRLRRYEDVSGLFEQLEYTGDVAFDVKGKNIVIRDVQK